MHINSLSLDPSAGTGGFDVDSGHSACDLSALSTTPQTNGGAGWTVPPRAAGTGGVPVDGTLAIDLTDALAMSTGASNACQSATFTVHLVAATS